MKFVRGDTFMFKVLLETTSGNVISISDISTLLITFRKYANEDSPIIFQKTLSDVTIDSNSYCHASFLPVDTEDLSYGKYYFDIELTLNNGYRKSRLYEVTLTQETTIHTTGGAS